MKNLHEELKNELRSRIRNYREKPEDAWWNEIAPFIVAPPPSRVPAWILRTSLVLFIVLSPIADELDDNGRGKKLVKSENLKTNDRSVTSEALNNPTYNELLPTASGPNVATIRSSDVPLLKAHEMKTRGDENISEQGSQSDPAEDYSLKAQQTTLDRIVALSFTEFEPKQDSIRLDQNGLVIEISEANPKDRRSDTDSNRKYSAYLTVMPTFGYQRITSNDQDNIIIQSINRIPAFSVSRLGIRAEIGIQRNSGKKMKVFGGILYYQRKQTIDYIEKVIDTTMVTPGPEGVVVEPGFTYEEKSFEYEIRNIGLQFGVNYLLSKGKFLQTIGTGLEFQMALNRINQVQQNLGFTANPKAYVFYNLFYRLEYPADGRLRAALQPTLNYSLYINRNFNAPFYVKPYGVGLNVGATYRF